MISSEIAGVIDSITFTPGAEAANGEVLLTLSHNAQAAAVAEADAQMRLAELELNRSQNLFDRQALPQQELDTAHATFAARQASVEIAQAELDKTTITAPFDGTLGALIVSLGDYVTLGTPLVGIVDKSTLKVRYSVPERYLSELALEQQVQLSIAAFGNEVFTGIVDFVSPSVDESTRTISIEARIDNEDGRLSSGLSVNLEHSLGLSPDVLVIPEEALMPAIEGYQVFRVSPDATVQSVIVEIGSRAGGFVQIIDGLMLGDSIVTQGYQKLRDGMPVQILPAEQSDNIL